MNVRPIAAAGVGMAAAVAFAAATTPAFAASDSLLDVSGNQGAGIVGVFDNQAAPQLAGGQVLMGQGNLNPDGRLLSRGYIDDVTQKNKAKGDAVNLGELGQTINHGGVGDDSLVRVVGNQVAGIVGVYDNQGALQLAGGQVGVLQGNLNAPIRVLAPGDNGDVQQGNWAVGNAQNAGDASQDINHGGTDGNDLIGIVGNQVAGIVGVEDNQVAGQGAIGQVGLAQVNANAPIRVLSPGDNGSVDQYNYAEGNACNQGDVAQTIDHQGSGSSLLNVGGNQASGIVGVGDNQAAGQAAVGQAGVAQGNLNLPINILSPGDDGPVTQTNESYGSAGNAGSASQDITH
jgi:hypothetical protein